MTKEDANIKAYVEDLEGRIKTWEAKILKAKKYLARVREKNCPHNNVKREVVEDVFGEYSGTISICQVCGKLHLEFDKEYYKGKYEEEEK